jgi:hypothetical protein
MLPCEIVDEMIDTARTCQQSLMYALAQAGRKQMAGLAGYSPLSEALTRVCMWIRRFENASATDRASWAMFEDWQEYVEKSSNVYTEWLASNLGPLPELPPVEADNPTYPALCRLAGIELAEGL